MLENVKCYGKKKQQSRVKGIRDAGGEVALLDKVVRLDVIEKEIHILEGKG